MIRRGWPLLFAGGLHALAFAPGPLPVWLLPLIQVLALALLAGAVWRASGPRAAAVRGWWFGAGTFAVGFYWIFISLHVYGEMAVWLAGLAVVLLAAALAVLPALGMALARRLAGPGSGGLGFVAAFAGGWAGTEWVRGWIFTGFPWLNAGYAHVDGPLSGYAPVLGVHGVALAAAVVAGAFALAACGRGPARVRAGAAGLIVLALGAGLSVARWGIEPAGRPISLRLVQGNVEQSNKFDPNLILDTLQRHLAMSTQPSGVAGFSPDLVVLPETAIPLFQDQLPAPLWQQWIDAAGAQGTALATGIALHTPGPDGGSRYTNSVIGFTGDADPNDLVNGRVPYRYDKAHLVPFGEFVPTGFRWFVNAMVMPMGDFDRGAKRQQPFAIAGQHIAFNICYEDVFGEELLPALRPGPNGEPGATLLANVSNLGWFGDSWALPQHLRIARMRSLELGRPSIRATNTGVTGVIDSRGRVQAVLPTHAAGVLDTVVQGTTGWTPYARWGNAAALTLIAMCLAGAGLRSRVRFR
ncbi:apolipoprotein N-acyltransferase [Verticiella sediminum]|uniref:apolipoprotein N-acyltransferase n=1 Tax=Verticiella sediminum TaxID=1247510 RepID=UPI001FEAD516|nr:apolipoprotein N-acyltransferase [Verticiella sediminum]